MKPYIKTGVMIVDMVCACINFHEKSHQKVKQITLHPIRYREFCDYVKRTDPEYVITDHVDFDDVLIVSGSTFMNESMYFELVKNQMTEA